MEQKKKRRSLVFLSFLEPRYYAFSFRQEQPIIFLFYFKKRPREEIMRPLVFFLFLFFFRGTYYVYVYDMSGYSNYVALDLSIRHFFLFPCHKLWFQMSLGSPFSDFSVFSQHEQGAVLYKANVGHRREKRLTTARKRSRRWIFGREGRDTVAYFTHDMSQQLGFYIFGLMAFVV